jgi:tripartite-type tricarboxylate transporter receptor subunit TctC
MKLSQKVRYLLPAVAMVLSATSAAVAHAQDASRVTTIRVAYPPGGPADVAARKIQPGLSNAISQTVIIENVPGAAGSIGAANVLAAAADGQTLLVTTGNDLILAPLAISHVKYKPESYRLLATILPTDFALVTNADYAYKSIDDLVERTRASSKEISMGSWGWGSAPFLVNADFKLATGVRLLDVPYKGAAPVIQALLTKEIDMAFVPLAPSVIDLINTGKIKLIGVANTQRNPFLPDVPTLNEGKSLKNFVYSAWAGIFVPASVPDAKVQALTKALGTIVVSDSYQQFLKDSAALPVKGMSQEQLASYFNAEMEKFRSIAKRIDLTPK